MKTLTSLLSCAVVLISMATTAPANAKTDETWTVIEFLGVQDVGRAKDYAAWMFKIAARHGVDFRTYEVTGTMKGDGFAGTTFAMVIKLPNQAAFQAVIDDPEYKADPLKRSEIWDFERHVMHSSKPILQDPAVK